ncbi:MAG: hypothetical protein WD275_05690 [Rhodothermales bacterium]
MTHRQQPWHRHNGSDPNRQPLIRANSSTSSDSLPELERTYYYELAPGTMINDHQTYVLPDSYQANGHLSAAYRQPRIHYDARTWSKHDRTIRNADPKQGALVVAAVSLFAMSVVAGTVLFAYYILSCYGIY